VDVVSVCTAVLHSPWLPLALVVLIALDAPFPMLPSETILMTGYAAAFADRDLGGVALLGLAALLGCVVGDLLVHALGRSSTRLVARHVGRAGPIAHWVTSTMLTRPLVALVAARFVPSGRLVSTAIAGRVGLPVRRFVPCTSASSSLWGVYMLVAGLLLGPVVADSPLLGLAVGAAMAAGTASAFGIYYRVRMRRLRRAATAGQPGTADFVTV
jgi:membrane protein DedA with SNARE-associated domain